MSKYSNNEDGWGKIKNRKARMRYEDYDEDYDMEDFNASYMDDIIDREEEKERYEEEEIDDYYNEPEITLPEKRFDLDSYLFDINLYQSKNDVKNISDDEYNKVLNNLKLAPNDIQKSKEYKLILKLFMCR